MYPNRPYRRRIPWFLLIGMVFLVAMVVILIVLLFTGAFGVSGHPFLGAWGGLLFVFLVLWIGFFLVRIAFWGQRMRYRGAGGGYAHPDPAVMVARRRYARGEITREQYDQIMADLGRQPPLP